MAFVTPPPPAVAPAPLGLVPPPPPGFPRASNAPEPSAAAAAGAAAAALLQRQLAGDSKDAAKSSGWTEHQTGDGRKFFFNEEAQTSSWEKPEVLMTPEEKKNDTAWREYRIWDGRVFYHNRETKVSCWSMPPEIRRLRGESSGIDETPMPLTNAEKRRAFWDLLKERSVDDTWTWSGIEEALGSEPASKELPIEARKQCFAELLGLCIGQKQIEAREKQRNAAKALERLIEERFSRPEDLGTSYEEAASLLDHEEAWQLIKSDLRRDEVFQTVMERLEEKHKKQCMEKRTERVIRLQRLMSSDPELTRPRLRWKDAAAILDKRDEIQEEDPPLEALRVWSSLRNLRPTLEYEQEAKKKSQPDLAIHRDDRKRRDAFIAILRERAVNGTFPRDMAWSDFEVLVAKEPACMALREGPGATAMELFDEFQEEIARGVAPEDACMSFEIDLAKPAETMPALVAPPLTKEDLGAGRPGVVKSEGRPGIVKSEEPVAKKARTDAPASSLVEAKEEIMGKNGEVPALIAAKQESQEPSPLEQLLKAADAFQAQEGAPAQPVVSTPFTKEELLDH